MEAPIPAKPDFATCEDAAAYDAWFRAKVERAMAPKEPGIPNDVVMAELRALMDKHRPC
jgi:hypothetical protein